MVYFILIYHLVNSIINKICSMKHDKMFKSPQLLKKLSDLNFHDSHICNNL